MATGIESEIEPLFGKREDAPDVKAFLSKLGQTEKLVVDPDDGNAYVSRPKQGFTLLFKDPARIKNPEYSSLKRDMPVLITCFMYSEGHEGYTQFEGQLPAGLSFADSRETVGGKLGKSEWQRTKDGQIVAEKWVIKGSSIHVTYTKDGNGILIVSHGIPQRF